MKRTFAKFAILAGSAAAAGGCMSLDTKKSMPMTSPAQKTAIEASRPQSPSTGFIQASALLPKMTTDSGIQQASHNHHGQSPEMTGPMQSKLGMMMGHGGILPVPGMGPPGAVAAVGIGGPGQMGASYQNQRTSIRFASPAGMKIAFQDFGNRFGDANREAPVRYNFVQGQIYRLRLSNIPQRPGKNYYPTLEVYPSTLKTVTFLSHATVPVGFTEEDFDQANQGNLVVKVIYLPDPQFQDLAAAEEIVSTRLEPGVDPVAEANRRGTILAIIRLGNIDLEDPSTPAMEAPANSSMPGRLTAPRQMQSSLTPRTSDALPTVKLPEVK
jgi:hypothetical protein